MSEEAAAETYKSTHQAESGPLKQPVGGIGGAGVGAPPKAPTPTTKPPPSVWMPVRDDITENPFVH